MATFVEWVARISTIPWMSAQVGGKWMYFFGVQSDAHADGVRDAIRSRFITTAPVDALPFAGADSNLERYPPDTDQTFRTRLENRWLTWETAGTEGGPSGEDGLEGELEKFGLPGAEVYEVWEWGDRYPFPYFSHFWIWIPTHPYTITGPHTYGEAGLEYGGGAVYGSGLEAQVLHSIRRLIKTFKPAHAKCHQIVFLVDGWAFGTGHVWGEPGLVFGGKTVAVGGS